MTQLVPSVSATLSPDAVLRRVQWTVLRRLDGALQGDYRTLFRGAGVDVADVREYALGDDARHIDWNVTARTDTPHVREYLQDREVTTWLVLDTSPSMRFGAQDRGKHHVLIELTAAMAQLLARGGNRVGALFFDNAVRETIPPAQGREQVLRIVHRALRAPVSAADVSGTDLAGALRAVVGIARRRSLIIVVSDLLTATGWQRPLTLLARRHDVLLLHVTDPRETHLPAVGLVWVEDAETGEHLLIDTDDPGFQQRLSEVAAQRRAELQQSARSAGVELLTISTEEDLLGALLRIVESRSRRSR